MTSEFQLEIYEGLLVRLTPSQKQNLGREFVQLLGGEAGPRGRDDGIDGWIPALSGGEIYFQVKLSKSTVSLDEIKLIRQSCMDRSSARAIFVSIREVSQVAARYLKQHRQKFQVCHVRIRDILQGKHNRLLEEFRLENSSEIAENLTSVFMGE